jgi:hypothetical protein
MPKFFVRTPSSLSDVDASAFLQTCSSSVKATSLTTFECDSDLGVPAFRRRVTTSIRGAIVSTSAPVVNRWESTSHLDPFVPYHPDTDLDKLTDADLFNFAERARAAYRTMDKPFPYIGSASRHVKSTRLVQVYLDPFGCPHAPRSLSDRRRLCLLLRPDVFDETEPLLDQLTCIEILKRHLNASGSTCVPSRSFFVLEDLASPVFGGNVAARNTLKMSLETGALRSSDTLATYLPTDFHREKLIVRGIRNAIRARPDAVDFADGVFTAVANEAQQCAIRSGLTSACSIITGFAGTGKTFVVSQIVKGLLRSGEFRHILLCAPTGAAAKRMRESLRANGVNVDADAIQIGTIHSSILYEKPKMVPLGFPPSVDMVIVDEMSMVDLKTMSYLFLGDDVNPRRRFVFVGDPGQLPSVSRGKIFSDLINSDRIPVVELTEVVRQSGGSEISELAGQIRTGSSMTVLVQRRHPCPTQIPFDPSVQVYFETTFSSVRDLLHRAIDVFQTEVVTAGGDPFNVQVLCPRVVHKGEDEGTLQVCCEDLNPEFSSANTVEMPYQYPPLDDWFAPGRSSEEVAEFNRLVDEFNEVHNTRFVTSKFRPGERVVCRKNNADREKKLVNGDMGTVGSARYEVAAQTWKYTILFRDVTSGPIEMTDEHLEMAYVTSVHKAQGNEYDSVILLIGRNDHWMWRELLYTAVTRAKRRLTILAMDESVIRGCTRNVAGEKRTTELCEVLRASV